MTASPAYIPAPAADFVLPFELEEAGLRGRIARLDASVTRALAAHPLPEAAQRILAEALGLSALLGSSLRLEGRLSLQLKGEGPLNLLATDYFAGGGLRGYARLDAERFEREGKPGGFGDLTGEGVLAITIEAKKGAQPYQGLVPLAREGLPACAENYFARSEQLPTMLKLCAGKVYRAGTGHGWRAGAFMVQAVPGREADSADMSDDWRRIEMFMKTLEDYELLDTGVAAESVLWRLFHDDEVRVKASMPLSFRCSCRAENIRAVLGAYPAEELKDLPDPDGVIRTRCEFCGNAYEFPLSEFEK